MEASNVPFVLVSCLCLIAACRGSFLLDLRSDPCFESVDSTSFDVPVRVRLNSNCRNGTVDWHMPYGTLELTYDKGDNSQFTFCMMEGWITNHYSYTDLTAGRNTDMAMPTAGHPSCISSDHGKVKVSVGDAAMTYMTTMRYRVTPSTIY